MPHVSLTVRVPFIHNGACFAPCNDGHFLKIK